MTDSNTACFQFCTFFSLLNLGMTVVFGYHQPSTAFINGVNSPFYTLITTHFTHHNHLHLFGNVLAMWLLLILFPSKTNTLCCAFIVCISAVAIYVLLTDIQSFLGFSALLYCIPGIFLFNSIVHKKYTPAITVLMIFFIYLYMIVPMSVDKNTMWIPMTHAHILGFISGFMAAFLMSQLQLKHIQMTTKI